MKRPWHLLYFDAWLARGAQADHFAVRKVRRSQARLRKPPLESQAFAQGCILAGSEEIKVRALLDLKWRFGKEVSGG